jgi:hypothetical protein
MRVGVSELVDDRVKEADPGLIIELISNLLEQVVVVRRVVFDSAVFD